jgi:hypothetical protein
MDCPVTYMYNILIGGQRNFRIITTIGFTTCVMGTWEILLTANTQGLVAGGLAGLFWSLCWAYTGQLFVILSLAEMASMWVASIIYSASQTDRYAGLPLPVDSTIGSLNSLPQSTRDYSATFPAG